MRSCAGSRGRLVMRSRRLEESFQPGARRGAPEYPHYTRPCGATGAGRFLTSCSPGHHANIRDFGGWNSRAQPPRSESRRRETDRRRFATIGRRALFELRTFFCLY